MEDEILIFKKFSEYKYFVKKSYNKNTWSRSLKSYLLILEKSVLMFRDINNISSLDSKKILQVYIQNIHMDLLSYTNYQFYKKEIKILISQVRI